MRAASRLAARWHVMNTTRDSCPERLVSSNLAMSPPKKVDISLPGQGNSNSHGARPVHQIISVIEWIRTSRLSIKNSESGVEARGAMARLDHHPRLLPSETGIFKTQSKFVAQLTLLVAITVLHRSCSVAAKPLHR